MRAVQALIVVSAVLGFAWVAAADPGFESVDFPTANGIDAHADLYGDAKSGAPLIVLFHQAGWSRGEYREIAPKLVAKGYRVMAVDQRSGGGVNGVANVTTKRATKKKLPRGYLDAYPDLVAALDYAKTNLNAPQVIVWGSSYSPSSPFRRASTSRSPRGEATSRPTRNS